MSYTTNQHVLSQWILRNFRSDDTATSKLDKKRVWCHTIYNDPEIENDVKDIPLPISSVAIKKNCFSLIDGDSGKKFDIENELSIYEVRTSKLFYQIIQKNNFEILLKVNYKNCPLDTLLNYIVIQYVLNLHNPQNKWKEKEDFFFSFIEGIIKDFENIKNQISSPPPELSDLLKGDVHKKIRT